MVGATRFELARPKSANFKSAVYTFPPSAYKIPNQSLEKYSGVLAPTSSMLFLARSMSYRTSHVPSIVELFTRSEAAYPSVTAADKYCREPLCYGNVCHTTQYGQSKSWLLLAACLSTRLTRLDIVTIRLIVASVLWGLEPHDAMHHRVHACGVEPLTNHIAYNTSNMSSLPSLTTLTSRLLFILAGAVGFEPTFQAPKTRVLTVGRYPNWNKVVGFEPTSASISTTPLHTLIPAMLPVQALHHTSIWSE